MQKVIIKTKEQIKKIDQASKIASKALEKLYDIISPGVSGLEIDQWCKKYFEKHDAISGCKGYKGFPANTCISVNNQACHGIPNNKPLTEGDIVTVDIVVKKDNFYSDTACTYNVGKISEKNKELIKASYQATMSGISRIKVGGSLLDIAQGIEDCIKNYKELSIVDAFCGHGVGIELHESLYILNTLPRSKKEEELLSTVIQEGMVFTVEPIIIIGNNKLSLDEDKHTIVGKENSSMFEHTVSITKSGYEILTKRNNEKYLLTNAIK